MTLTEEVAKKIIVKLLKGEDYRIEIITLINAQFLQFAIEFFKKITEAKLNNENITPDWYKKVFLDTSLSSDEIGINSGLNKKTIKNMFNSTKRQVVLDASSEHYDTLLDSIVGLTEIENEFNLTLNIRFRTVSVDLTVSETLIVINTLAVKRAALRGGLWSTAGKRVEKPLMLTLCKLYGVAEENYKIKLKKKRSSEEAFIREIDFYLCKDDNDFKCEVKLMGQGNPESADAVIARASKVFVADKLSDTNIAQLDSLQVCWVELRRENGYKRFKKVLEDLSIPHTNYEGNIIDDIETIFASIFSSSLSI